MSNRNISKNKINMSITQIYQKINMSQTKNIRQFDS